MSDERLYDSKDWVDATGAATGDARENDPRSAGFTNAEDRLYRSQFQRVNRLADHADPRPPDDVKKDFDTGDGAQQGRVSDMPPAGTTPTHDRVSFSDPIAGNVDPTSRESADFQP